MEGDDLLVGERQHHLGAPAVLELEHLIDAVTPGALPQISRIDHRHQHLLAADRVHLLAHDLRGVLVGAPAGGQERPQPGAELADEAGADHQLVGQGLGVGRRLLLGGEQVSGETGHLRGKAILQARPEYEGGAPHGLRSTAAALRLRRPRAPYRRGDDEGAPRQAPPGLRGQGQRRARGHRLGRQADRGGPPEPRLAALRQAGPGPQQRRRPLQPLAVLGVDEPGRRRRALRRARRRDQRRVRLVRRLQGEAQGDRRRPVRLRLGLARPRRLGAGDRRHAEPGHARCPRARRRSWASTSGSTPTT